MPRVHIGKVGTFTAMSGEKVEFTEEMFRDAAAAYDPKLFKSPIVKGHPKHDAPAHGWVTGLTVEGENIYADADQVAEDFADDWREGRYGNVSASWYKPDSPNNPVPGSYYLRHIGVLGAMPPAIKGLEHANFSDKDGDFLTVEFGEYSVSTTARIFGSIREFFIEKFGREEADTAVPGFLVDGLMLEAGDDQSFSEPAASPDPATKTETKPTKEESSVTEEELERQQKALKEREDALKKREADFAEQQAGEIKAGNKAFVEGLVKDGRPLPCDQGKLLSFMEELGSGDSVDFGEGDQRSPLDFFKSEILAKLPQSVDFSEQAGADQGEPVTKDGAEIGAEASAYMAEMASKGITVSATEAVNHVTKKES